MMMAQGIPVNIDEITGPCRHPFMMTIEGHADIIKIQFSDNGTALGLVITLNLNDAEMFAKAILTIVAESSPLQ